VKRRELSETFWFLNPNDDHYFSFPLEIASRNDDISVAFSNLSAKSAYSLDFVNCTKWFP